MKTDGSNCVFGLKRFGALIILFNAPDMVENCSVEIMVEMVAEEMLLAADKTSTVTDKPGRATMNDEKPSNKHGRHGMNDGKPSNMHGKPTVNDGKAFHKPGRLTD